MSVIGKTPFVKSILSSLSSEEMATLRSLVNNLGSATDVRLFGTQNVIGNDNKGVSHVLMVMEPIGMTAHDGILCYHDDSHCGLFVINDSLPEMQAFKIDPANLKYESVFEHLSADEFRSVLDDVAEGGGDEWVERMKPTMDVNDDDEVEIYDPVRFDEDVAHEGKVKLVDFQKITDVDGEPFIPDPTGHVGKFLCHITTGYDWVAAGGTQFYKHELKRTGDVIPYVIVISKKATAYTDMDFFQGLSECFAFYAAIGVHYPILDMHYHTGDGNIKVFYIDSGTITNKEFNIATDTITQL